MCSLSDQTGILGILKIKIFAANNGGKTFEYFFKKWFCGFYTLVVVSL